MLRGLQNLLLPRLRDPMAARTANLVLTLRNALIVLLLRRTADGRPNQRDPRIRSIHGGAERANDLNVRDFDRRHDWLACGYGPQTWKRFAGRLRRRACRAGPEQCLVNRLVLRRASREALRRVRTANFAKDPASSRWGLRVEQRIGTDGEVQTVEQVIIDKLVISGTFMSKLKIACHRKAFARYPAGLSGHALHDLLADLKHSSAVILLLAALTNDAEQAWCRSRLTR